MTKEIKKLNKYRQPLGIYFLSPKRILFFLIAIFIFTIFAFETIDTKVFAATGINRTINFQGKVVNKDGTNVADGEYTFVFKLYDAASGGANPWTETQNNVQVTAGIFRVSLGSTTTFASAGIDFNTDNLYLAINFNSDGEMTPRVRFAAVPYAINAETVGGLTVTSTTGTLTIPNAKVVQFGGAFTTSAQDLTLTLSGATNVSFPTTGTLATLAGTENLSNKSFTSTVTFSGVTSDITTGTNEDLSINPNGTGKIGINTTSPLATFDVRGQSGGGTSSIASFSGITSFAALLINNNGTGDIFAASSSATTRFVIKNDGTASSSAGFTVDGVGNIQSTSLQTLTLGGGSTGNLILGRTGQVFTLPGFDCSGSGNGGKLTTTTGGVLTCSADGAGTSSYSPFQESTSLGINYQVNTTEDFLIGGVATDSAKFAILGVAGTTVPTASVSAQNALGQALVLGGDGSVQSTRNNNLILGGNTTGNIFLRPGNSNGIVKIIHGDSGDGGLFLATNETDATTKNARIKMGHFTNAEEPISILVGNNNGADNNLFFGGGSGSENSSTDIHFMTGASNTTLTGSTRMHISRLGNVSIGDNSYNAPSKLFVTGTNAGSALVVLNETGTNDLLIASVAGVTKFVIKNDGTASSSAGFTIDGAGNIQSTRNQALTIGGNSTGNILFQPANNIGNGTVGIGPTPTGGWMGNLYISGDYGGKALSVFNSTSSTQDILTASSSGTARFSITNSGGIKLGVDEGGLGQCLMSNGSGLGASWAGCAAGGVGWWNLVSSQGTLIPVNTTLDMLWGGIATASATFHLFGSVNSGTTAVASISANSSFAGLVIDQRGTGDFLTASASGVTKFTITKSGGITASDGLTINKTGSNDIVKTTSGNDTIDTDFQRTANSTSSTLTNLDNSGGEMTLAAGTVSGDGTITTAGQPTIPAALGAGASSITRQDGKYLVIRGGVTTTMYVYDSLADNFATAPIVANANVGVGSIVIPRQNGKYLLVHGNSVATTSLIDPMGNTPTVAGPTATGTNGAGTNAFRRQNGQYLLIHGGAAGTSRVYNPVANTFAAGPTAASTTWAAGSLVLPRQNGTALIVTGGSSANTRLYNPFDGAASIGSFTAGPSLPTNCEINGAGSVALQMSNGRYIILSKAGVSVEYNPESNTMGPCQNVGPTAALADGAHGIRLQDRRFLIFRGSGTTDAYIYDPETNAYSSHATSTSTQGAGLHSVQRADGTWQIFVGGSTTTNNYDSQLTMNGSYVSEDIQSSGLNPDSSIWFTGGAEARFSGTSSATLSGDLPQTGMEINVQSSSSQGGLDSATSYPIRRNGDKIMAGNDHSWIRVTVNFTRPLPQQLYDERFTWMGNGKTVALRDYQDPTLYDYMIDNSTVLVKNQFDWTNSQGVGDPTEASSSAFTRVQAMADRITLPWGKVPGPTQVSTNIGFYLGIMGTHPPMLQPTGEGTLVIQRPGGLITVIASGSANMSLYDPSSSQFTAQSGAGNIPTANVGDGAFALKLFNGKFLIVMGQNTATTNIYDPNAGSGSQFVQGPNLSGNAGAGAQAIPNKDGTYTIVHGNALTTTSVFNPYTDLTLPPGTTLPTGPTTTTAVNCGSWAIPLSGQMQDTYRVFVGRAQFTTGINTTMMYDSTSKQFTAGPNLTTVHGCGSYAFQRQDGWWVTVGAAAGTNGAQTTTLNILNPWSNTTLLGPALTAAVGRGSFVLPRADGTFLISRGQSQTINGNGTNIYFPWGGTFGVGTGIGTSTAGPVLIDYAGTPGTTPSGAGALTFQRPDGKWVIVAGGHTGSNIVNLYDAGWYPDGQYLSNIMHASTLSSDSTLAWRKTNDNFVDFEVRTAPTRESISTTPFRSVSRSGDKVGAGATDKWIQIQVNFSRRFMWYDGVNTDVAKSRGALGAQIVSQPTVFEYKVNNAFDFLILKNGGLNALRVDKYGGVWTGQQGGFYTGGADLAENYSSKETLAKGEVVSIDGISGDHNIKKSSGQYQPNMLGVVSTNPGFVAGSGTEDAYPVALVGRVPVKISTENGPIREGDALTSASIPGYAMKATVGGRVLGRALQSFDESTAEECPALGMGNFDSTKCGTLMLFVNLVDFNGESVNVAMKDSGFTLDEKELPVVAGIDFSEGTEARRQQEILGFLKTQKDHGQGIYTDRVAATQEIISPQIVTDLLIAKKIKAESIEGLEIITNSIEMLSNRISTGSAVTNFSDRITLLVQNQDQFQSQMASIAAKLEKMDNLNLLTMANISSGEGQLTTVANLAVFNTATFAQASVLDNLQVGNNMTLSMNAINTIGEDLEIQPLKQGAINFLGGLIRFDTDGKVTFAEDVSFQKNVAVTGVLSARTVASTELQLAQGTTTVLSDTEVDSTAAAGLVTLKRGTNHVKINNPLVKENSFIFITPKTKTSQNLFLLAQKEAEDEEKGSFTVGVDGNANDDIKFNYLIVN